MKKEKTQNKASGKEIIIRNILIVVTLISLIINAMQFTNAIYSWCYDTTRLNDLLVSPIFTFILWADNILVYLFAAWYMVLAERSKQEVVLKIAFSLFAILTTITASTLIVNVIAELFGVF